jgi:hypothetical protein
MTRLRRLFAAMLVACMPAAHAASDAEVRQWLNELVGSALVLQALGAGHCSESMRPERVDVAAWYSWAAALGSPDFRASAEARKADALAQARSRVDEWVANEFRAHPGERLRNTCYMYSGMFRTIREAAESELEDIEYGLKGRVTPRAER